MQTLLLLSGWSMVHLSLNFVGVKPMDVIQKWSSKEKKRVDIPCQKITKLNDDAMGGVWLAYMSIVLYRIVVKTHRW